MTCGYVFFFSLYIYLSYIFSFKESKIITKKTKTKKQTQKYTDMKRTSHFQFCLTMSFKKQSSLFFCLTCLKLEPGFFCLLYT